jgi:hypothetical protein
MEFDFHLVRIPFVIAYLAKYKKLWYFYCWFILNGTQMIFVNVIRIGREECDNCVQHSSFISAKFLLFLDVGCDFHVTVLLFHANSHLPLSWPSKHTELLTNGITQTACVQLCEWIMGRGKLYYVTHGHKKGQPWLRRYSYLATRT